MQPSNQTNSPPSESANVVPGYNPQNSAHESFNASPLLHTSTSYVSTRQTNSAAASHLAIAASHGPPPHSAATSDMPSDFSCSTAASHSHHHHQHQQQQQQQHSVASHRIAYPPATLPINNSNAPQRRESTPDTSPLRPQQLPTAAHMQYPSYAAHNVQGSSPGHNLPAASSAGYPSHGFNYAHPPTSYYAQQYDPQVPVSMVTERDPRLSEGSDDYVKSE